jgi:ATP synthase protein I
MSGLVQKPGASLKIRSLTRHNDRAAQSPEQGIQWYPSCCLGECPYDILLLVCGVTAMSMRSGEDKPPSANDWAGLVLVGQLGLTVAIPILLGIGVGLFIDSKLRSSPIATLIGLLLGLAAGVYGAYRLVTSLR